MHENIVEYAIREVMKGKKPSTAARITRDRHRNSHNVFLGGNVGELSTILIEDRIWSRLVQFAKSGMASMKPGMEHYAIGSTIHHFNLPMSCRSELKRRLVKETGFKFPNDDGK
jgi:hypothetical protein